MGSGNYEVVDISSDEEGDREYLGFLVNKSVFDESDSTDVVEVVSEVKGNHHSRRNSWTQAASLGDDDDDDCVILDCDPVKTRSAAVEAEADDDDDDDEVLVVGEKGEIACRDFPHPRHSCAKYSFNSTSHESYCDMCHCYVCDIPAPCPYWCVAAVSSVDHCHANDKDKRWTNQREYFRTGKKIPTLPPAHATVSPPPSIIRLHQKPSPRNRIEIRPCSSSSSRLAANLSNVRGGRNRVSVRNNVIQKDSTTFMGSLRSRVTSPGTRAYGNTVKAGLHTNAKVSQSTHLNNPSVVAPPVMHTQQQQQQQRNCQLNVTDYCAAVRTGSQKSNADLFRLPEWGSTVQQQQPGTNENVLQSKLSEVESWLMDSCNQAGLVSPLPDEPVAQDNVTFDFETFLND